MFGCNFTPKRMYHSCHLGKNKYIKPMLIFAGLSLQAAAYSVPPTSCITAMRQPALQQVWVMNTSTNA